MELFTIPHPCHIRIYSTRCKSRLRLNLPILSERIPKCIPFNHKPVRISSRNHRESTPVLRRDLANHDESLSAVLMTRFPLTDGDAGQRGLQINVPVIDVRLEIALILGAEGAVRAAEGWRFAALVQQVPFQDVRVLVTLTASRAIVAAIVMRQTATAADARVIVVATGGVPRRTVQPGTAMRRQRRRHVARR